MRTAALALALCVPALLPAQRVQVSVTGMVAGPRSTEILGDSREAAGGLWLGGALGARYEGFTLEASGLRGRLVPITSTSVERDEGQVTVVLGFDPQPGLGVEATYTARAFSSGVGYQRWNTFGVGGRVALELGDPSLHAYGRVAYLPVVEIRGQDRARLGLAAEIGATLAVPRSRLLLEMHYRLERYDFTNRLAEFDLIALRVRYAIPLPGSPPGPDTR